MQQKSMLEILEETVQYYSEDVRQRGVEAREGCRYLIKKGNMCAVGRCMIEPTTQMSGRVQILYVNHRVGFANLENYLKPEYRGHPVGFWSDLQSLHDGSDYWTTTGLTKKGKDRENKIRLKFCQFG